jgi:hypothetical protein
MRSALSYGGIVVTASGLYVASLVMRLRRKVEAARARLWLIATPRVDSRSIGATVLPVAVPLLLRYLVALAAMFLLSLDSAVTLQQSLQLAALVTIGAAVGTLSAAALARPRRKRRNEGSRYILRPTRSAHFAPSSAALSHWPIAQAFAWSRPENARFLLAAAILSAPGGTGVLGALLILVMWVVVSYLVAVLVAIPYVARTASEWLRSTPMTFWAFAWPLARRAVLHQICGTLIAIAASLMLGSSPLTAIYLGTLWMTIVVTTAAIGLADCYRARSATMKTTLSIVSALVVEERAQGWGISLALLLGALHLRVGASYERP